MSNTRVRKVKETNLGVYVWITADGKVVKDTEGNFMNISAVEGDRRAQELIAAAARSYGIEGGYAKFWEGARPISDEEYAEQQGRLAEGFIPDALDPGNRKQV